VGTAGQAVLVFEEGKVVPRWVGVLFPSGRVAAFTPAGELLHASPGIEDECRCLVRQPGGAVDLLSYPAFVRLVQTREGKERPR
jgi:hypothetical protein